jgi:hypothetical protein
MLHCAPMAAEADDNLPRRDNAPRLQLWFELFRDLALIELAMAGGIITLMGTVFVDVPRRGGAVVGVAALGLGAICSLIAQTHVVELSDKGHAPDKWLRNLRAATLVLLGAGAGSFVMFALRGLGLR